MSEAQAARPEAKELRNFGLVLGAVLATLFGLFRLARHHGSPLWPWIIAAALWMAALLAPRSLGYIYRGWTRLGHLLGWINTRVILTIIYAVAIVPLGLAMRLFGRDRMARKFDPAAASYRVPSHQRPHKHMERPF
jgi:hypothetical protein